MKSARDSEYSTIERWTPTSLKAITKRIYYGIIRFRNRIYYIDRGKFVEYGYRFRFSRIHPFRAVIGDRTILEEFNIWNAKMGNIIVGRKCWFGLHNILMGPVRVGDNVSTGPYVCILGPRHPVSGYEKNDSEETIIGNNVWISAHSVILFGVKIGDNAIISAGSVVMKDVQDGGIVSGNPARDFTKMASKMWGS